MEVRITVDEGSYLDTGVARGARSGYVRFLADERLARLRGALALLLRSRSAPAVAALVEEMIQTPAWRASDLPDLAPDVAEAARLLAEESTATRLEPREMVRVIGGGAP